MPLLELLGESSGFSSQTKLPAILKPCHWYGYSTLQLQVISARAFFLCHHEAGFLWCSERSLKGNICLHDVWRTDDITEPKPFKYQNVPLTRFCLESCRISSGMEGSGVLLVYLDQTLLGRWPETRICSTTSQETRHPSYLSCFDLTAPEWRLSPTRISLL